MGFDCDIAFDVVDDECFVMNILPSCETIRKCDKREIDVGDITS